MSNKLVDNSTFQHKSLKLRIYPTEEQKILIDKTFGCCRKLYNEHLQEKNEFYIDNILPIKNKATKTEINNIYKTFKPKTEKEWKEVYPYMKEVSSTSLQQARMDCDNAFVNFFKSNNGTRKGKFVKPPKFKSKKNMKESIGYTTMAKPKFVNGKLFITRKLGLLKGSFGCRFAEGVLRSVTISRTATGKWFVSILVEKKDEPKNKNGKAIGIDWNCRDDCFLTLSDGTKIKCPRFLREKEVQLARHQRKLSKKFRKGVEVQSNNYYKEKYLVAKIHEKVAWQRADWLHKLSRELCNKYETIVVEDINLQNMASNLHHGVVLADQGFGMLRQMIAYKGNLVKVNPKNTSKTCHCCGYVNKEVVVGVEKWKCPVCGENHDRDINAAQNILYKGVVGRERAEITNACGVPRSTAKQEVSQPLQAFRLV